MPDLRIALAVPLFALAASPALAQEVYAGASFHAVDLPTSLDNGEGGGYDLQLGLRSAPIAALDALGKPSAYVHAQVSPNRTTSFVAAGLSWKLGDRVYVRPGIGLAVNTDRMPDYLQQTRVDLGSRITFEPEVAVGARVSDRTALELSWVHVSHATLFNGDQNPGMDFLGARLVYRLGK